MGKKSRDKGGRGEREAAVALEKVLGLPWKRSVGQYSEGDNAPDVIPAGWKSDLWVEVKRGKQPPIRPALEQAVRESTEKHVPVALTRKDHGEWLLTLRLEDIWSLYEELEAMKDELQYGRVHRTQRASRKDLEEGFGVGDVRRKADRRG